MIIGIPSGLDPRYFESVATTIAAIVVVWMTLIALTGWLASRRNWDDGLWAALALLTGPIALLIVALAPKRFTPPSKQNDVTYREAAAAPHWPVFPAREPRMTRRQRIVSSAMAALLGGAGAAFIAGEMRPVVLIVVGAGAVAAATVGRWLGPSLVASTTGWKAWVMLSTAAVSLSIAAVLTVAVLGVPAFVVGTGGIFEYVVYLAAAVFYPFVSAIFQPAPLVIAIAASGAWVIATSLLVNRRRPGSMPAMHPSSQ